MYINNKVFLLVNKPFFDNIVCPVDLRKMPNQTLADIQTLDAAIEKLQGIFEKLT